MSGSVTLNEIDDAGLIKVLQVKEKHQIGFNPQVMNVTNQGNPPKQIYNNVVLSWQTKEALGGVIEILQHIHGK